MGDGKGPSYHLECLDCKSTYPPENIHIRCRRCHGLLTVTYDIEALKDEVNTSSWRNRPPTVWSYWEAIPLREPSARVTLREGGTGLHRCRNLGGQLGVKRLYVKNEGENPTGSFKDRGMTVGVSRAVELGKKKVACASTGNTSSSLAAYSAKARLECIVLIPREKVAVGKLAQAVVYGARILEVDGNFDYALQNVLRLTELYEEIYLLNSVNPYRIEGQKTLAFEIWAQLKGRPPDMIVIPVGNAGNIRAVWKGFTELKLLGLIDCLPRMIGVQAEGASPIAQAYRNGLDSVKSIKDPDTVATAIRIGSPVNGKIALRVIKESHGMMETVTDGEILAAQRLLASHEGLFVEPASAASLAALKKLLGEDRIEGGEVIVCITTGHGLKDPNIIAETLPHPRAVRGGIEEIAEALGLG